MWKPEARMVPLTEIRHDSGVISVAEYETHIPFHFSRVYFIHGLRATSERGAHAHVNLWQAVVAVAGSFTVELEGIGWGAEYQLSSPSEALIIPPLTWRDLRGFSDGSVCLVIASDKYSEEDYIRKYEDFRAIVTGNDATG